MNTLELTLLDSLYKCHTPWMDRFWVIITHLGDGGLIWIGLTALLIYYKPTRRVGILCGIALVLGALMTNGILKNLMQRARPYHYRDLILLIKEPHDFSFPSGHTTSSFAVAFVVLRQKLTLGGFRLYMPTVILAGLVAFSRLYLYVHFPSDILSALVIAYLASLLSERIYLRYLQHVFALE